MEGRALWAQIDAETPPTKGVWFTVRGYRVRRHTKASAIIQNILRDVLEAEAHKYAFKIEDALNRKGLLHGER